MYVRKQNSETTEAEKMCSPDHSRNTEKNALSGDKLELLVNALLLESLKVRAELLVVTGNGVQPIKNQLLALRDPVNISNQLLDNV